MPKCGVSLRVNFDRPLVVALIISVPLGAFMYLFRHWLNDLPELLFSGAVAGSGFGIWWLACHLIAKVERDAR